MPPSVALRQCRQEKEELLKRIQELEKKNEYLDKLNKELVEKFEREKAELEKKHVRELDRMERQWEEEVDYCSRWDEDSYCRQCGKSQGSCMCDD